MKRATIPLVFLSLVLFCETSMAWEGIRRFRKGEWEVSAESKYVGTDANYKSSGGQESLSSGGKYFLLDTNLKTRYVLDGWALNAGGDIGYAESKSSLGVTRTNSSFTGGEAGVEMMWDLGEVQLIPEFSQYFPIEKTSLTQDAVMSSEGASESRFRLHMQTGFSGFSLFGNGGYIMRGEGRSNLFRWSAGILFPGRTVSYGGRLFGYQSISDDKDTGGNSEVNRNATAARVNGGSLMFYGVNPSVIDSEAYIRFQMSPSWLLAATGGMTLNGSRVASTYHVGAILTYRFTPQPLKRLAPRTNEPRLSIDPYTDHFQEDTDDGIDQQLFKPAPTQPEPPSAEDAVKMKKAQTRIELQEQKRLQQQLDEAEMTIELKSNKKKKKKNSY